VCELSPISSERAPAGLTSKTLSEEGTMLTSRIERREEERVVTPS
jgi:hypothetical protein